MPETISLFDLEPTNSVESKLDKVRLGADPTAIYPFTDCSQPAKVHYCSEPDINDYVLCNNQNCVLCGIGRKVDDKVLLPVYLLTENRIAVLPVSRSLRPYSLLPQLLNGLKAQKPVAMFITREGGKYLVSTTELKSNVDNGELQILSFLEDWQAGHYDLTSVFLKISNEALASVNEISKMMALRGITL